MEEIAVPENPLGRLRRETDSSPYHRMLGLEAVSADAATGSVTLRLQMRPEFRRAADDSFVHGGIIAALIDITGHAAVAVQIDRMAPTIDLRIDYLRRPLGEAASPRRASYCDAGVQLLAWTSRCRIAKVVSSRWGGGASVRLNLKASGITRRPLKI
jgi:uncharacterized protein (TIGR00369 family)